MLLESYCWDVILSDSHQLPDPSGMERYSWYQRLLIIQTLRYCSYKMQGYGFSRLEDMIFILFKDIGTTNYWK